MPDHFWFVLVVAGTGGVGIGIGLVVGAWVVRMLGRYIRDDNGRP